MVVFNRLRRFELPGKLKFDYLRAAGCKKSQKVFPKKTSFCVKLILYKKIPV